MLDIGNRLAAALGTTHPILSAPMAFAGGGELAAAVSRAGGLGLIGGGYGDAGWLESQFEAAGAQRVGVGFITWSLAQKPELLPPVLERRPVAVMLSFGDPRPFADAIHEAGSLLICQCQNLGHAEMAIDAGADVVVAQGAEAGGHGATRGTITLVPELADRLAAAAPHTLLVAAGGIADGRGLVAALMLGADGVLVGTRFWASREALVHGDHHAALLRANGDSTLRTKAVDVARELAWPPGFTARVMQNEFTRRWHGREEELRAEIATQGPAYREAFARGDPDDAGVWFGEAAGIIPTIEPAGDIVAQMVEEARRLLARGDDPQG